MAAFCQAAGSARATLQKRNMKIHPLITTTEALAELCERWPRPISSASTPNSCARTPIGLNFAWSRSPTTEEAAAIDPLAPGIDLTPLLNLLVDRERGRAQGLPRRRAGRGNRLQPHRQDPAPDLRHADRDDGDQPVRADRLFQPGRIVAGDHGGQGRPLYRLVAPPADRTPDRICHRRRDLPRQDLPQDP
jgi:hypothetical protein